VLYARLHPRAQRALHAEAALAGQHLRGIERPLVAHAVDHADPVVGLGELLLDDAGTMVAISSDRDCLDRP
jgi:hypothetical protein